VVLLIVMALVWITEIFNTCIEKVMDFVSPEYHPKVKVIKDIAAAAGLIMAIVAVIAGGMIFIPKLF
jgi:diacylglycerol kinase